MTPEIRTIVISLNEMYAFEGGVLTQKIPVATPKSVNWDWVFWDFLGF